MVASSCITQSWFGFTVHYKAFSIVKLPFHDMMISHLAFCGFVFTYLIKIVFPSISKQDTTIQYTVYTIIDYNDNIG